MGSDIVQISLAEYLSGSDNTETVECSIRDIAILCIKEEKKCPNEDPADIFTWVLKQRPRDELVRIVDYYDEKFDPVITLNRSAIFCEEVGRLIDSLRYPKQRKKAA